MLVEKDYFYNNGKYEIELLKQVKCVIGRTDWDKKVVSGINSNIKYFRLNDSLRDTFYLEPKWNYNSCQKHSIFITQAQYPIKVFHLLLQAISLIKYKYPDIKIYVAGNNPFNTKFYRLSSYQLYIKKIIKKFELQENININLNNVIKKAYRLFDRDKNYNDLINIYNSVINENNNL